MATNMKMMIEILIKNEKEFRELLAQLNEKFKIEIDLSQLDKAFADLKALPDEVIPVKVDDTDVPKKTEKIKKELKKIPAKKETIISAKDRATAIINTVSNAYMALMHVFSKVRRGVELFVLVPKDAARDAEETASKYATVFDEVGAKAEQVAESISNSFGIATTTSKELLGATGDILVGFGFSADMALDLSKQVNSLAIDLASFTNYSGGAKGASEALTKAVLGETESAKALGIVLRQGTKDFKDRVAALKIEKNYTENQARALILLEDAMKQSGKAQGDFARTQHQLANQERILSESFKTLKEQVGDKLTPVFLKGSKAATSFIRSITETSLESTTKELKDKRIQFEGLAITLTTNASNTELFEKAQAELNDIFGDTLGNLDSQIEKYGDLELAVNGMREKLIELETAKLIYAEQEDHLREAGRLGFNILANQIRVNEIEAENNLIWEGKTKQEELSFVQINRLLKINKEKRKLDGTIIADTQRKADLEKEIVGFAKDYKDELALIAKMINSGNGGAGGKTPGLPSDDEIEKAQAKMDAFFLSLKDRQEQLTVDLDRKKSIAEIAFAGDPEGLKDVLAQLENWYLSQQEKIRKEVKDATDKETQAILDAEDKKYQAQIITLQAKKDLGRDVAEELEQIENEYLEFLKDSYGKDSKRYLLALKQKESATKDFWKNTSKTSQYYGSVIGNAIQSMFGGMLRLEVETENKLTQGFANMANSFIAEVERMIAKWITFQIIKGMLAPGTTFTTFLGFADGKYTGDGGKYEPAGIVHKGEWILGQDVTQPNLAELPTLHSLLASGVRLRDILTGGISMPSLVTPNFNIPTISYAGGGYSGSGELGGMLKEMQLLRKEVKNIKLTGEMGIKDSTNPAKKHKVALQNKAAYERQYRVTKE